MGTAVHQADTTALLDAVCGSVCSATELRAPLAAGQHTHTHTQRAHTHARSACTHARTHARTYARTHARTHTHARARTHVMVLLLPLALPLAPPHDRRRGGTKRSHVLFLLVAIAKSIVEGDGVSSAPKPLGSNLTTTAMLQPSQTREHGAVARRVTVPAQVSFQVVEAELDRVVVWLLKQSEFHRLFSDCGSRWRWWWAAVVAAARAGGGGRLVPFHVPGLYGDR